MLEYLGNKKEYNLEGRIQDKLSAYDKTFGENLTEEQKRDLITDEIVAETFVEIFSDGEFLNEFQAQHKGILEIIAEFINKFISGINWLLNNNKEYMAFADNEVGFKKLLTLEKTVKDALVRNANKETSSVDGDVRYDIEQNDVSYSTYDKPITQNDIQELRSIGRKSINEFTNKDIEKAQKWAYKFYKELGIKSPFFRAWFGDWRAYEKNTPNFVTLIPQSGEINRKTRKIKNSDTGWAIKVDNNTVNDSVYNAKKQKGQIERLLLNINEILKNAILLDTAISQKNSNKKGSTQFMHYLYSVVEYNGNPFLVKVSVEEYGEYGNDYRAYNATRIKMSALSRKDYDTIKSMSTGSASNADAISVADLFNFVKQFDEKFKPKEVNQAMLNEDGTPKLFYHGTDQKFTVFDHTKGRANMDIQGMFFSPWELDAKGYGSNVGQYYLNIKNPASETEGYKALSKFKGQNNAGAKARDYLISLGFDGVNNSDEEIIAFYPEQIKSATTNKGATDNIGTFDRTSPDIRYQLSYNEDIDEFDSDEYNNIKLSATEYNRLYSEAMSWDADKIGEICRKTLNGYTYRYKLDEHYNLTVLSKGPAINIHERRKRYNEHKQNRGQVNSDNGRGWSRQRFDSRGMRDVENRREDAKDDRLYQSSLSGERRSDRTGHSENGNNVDLQEKNGKIKHQLSYETDRAIADEERGLSYAEKRWIADEKINPDIEAKTIGEIQKKITKYFYWGGKALIISDTPTLYLSGGILYY